MSKPTIIMITHSASDSGINRLNQSILDKVGIYGKLSRVDSIAAGWDLNTYTHIGSFNHLDEPLFMQLVRDAGWDQPSTLQIFLNREDDNNFTEYDLFDEIIPSRLAMQAKERGKNLPAPSQQTEFFERICLSEPTEIADGVSIVEMSVAWMFEVLAIRDSYFFEANSKIIDQTLHTGGFSVTPFYLAFNGIGVRSENREAAFRDYANDDVKDKIARLNPGDVVQILGKVRPGPKGIVELYDVSSITIK